LIGENWDKSRELGINAISVQQIPSKVLLFRGEIENVVRPSHGGGSWDGSEA
jgi:hypothetical protein